MGRKPDKKNVGVDRVDIFVFIVRGMGTILRWGRGPKGNVIVGC